MRILLPITISLVLVGCQRETPVEQANREGIFLMGNSAEPKSLDHQMVSGVPESKIVSALFEGLVGDHPKLDDGMPPGAAASWSHNEELTEWTFKLQPEGRWSDGEPVTAHDFVFSYRRLLTPALAAPYVEMLYFIENSEAYNKDLRGEILFRISPVPEIDWEMLAGVNFRGDRGIDLTAQENLEWPELDDPQRLEYVTAKGLDFLGKPQLEWIAGSPRDRFHWPAGFELHQPVIARMLEHAGTSLWDLAKVGAAAPDDLTLVVKLKEPVPFLPSLTRHYTWFPVPRHVILQHGEIGDRFTAWSKLENIVGNGPFKISEWRFHSVIETVRNVHYWDNDNVHLNGVRFFPIENPYTETRAFLAGQLHTTYMLPSDLIRNTAEKYPQFLRQEPYVGTTFIRFNTTRPALSDPRVRKAMSLSVNRELLTKFILEGYTPATSLTPKMGDYQPDPVLEFDPERARELLAEAGFPKGRGFPRYSLLISRPAARANAEALQAMWRDHLGILVEIENKDWGSYISTQQNLDYDLSVAGWIGDYLDPTTFLNMWTEGNGNNNTGWFDKTYEEMLSRAANEADPAKRYSMLAEAEAVLMEARPIIPVSWYSRNYLLRPEVKGWHPLLLDNHPWKAIRLESN